MDANSIKKGFDVLISVAGLLVVLVTSIIIGGLMVGVLTSTATDGSIPVSTAMNTSLSGVETTYISTITSIMSQPAILIALVVIVVLALVFGFKFNLGSKGGKGSSGGMQ
jgi:cytochrome bd-type quinol oxidase subunit 2